ncbi:MAG TPA: AsmA-like C-terminal region-containing protein [Candidatus Saccharimonadales bacterium]|nr:AsmA-like C-terminal region-containing protein [Candidatus Saccharimonadales bacterium]
MRNQIGFWRGCRTCFRHLRRVIIFAALVLICAIVWLNQIGLPDFLKRPLVETLRERGIELEFARLRLSLHHGLVAENVRIGQAEKTEGPVFSIRQVQLRLDYYALLHRRLQIRGLTLRQGKFVWPLSSANTLTLDHVQTDLRFEANDTWSLDNFQADFAGAKIMLSGDIAHALALRNWQIFHATTAATTNITTWQSRWQKIGDVLNEIHFSGAPQLSLTMDGDARDPRSFRIHLIANVPAADTPWGRARAIQVAARLMAFIGAPTNSNPSLAWWTNVEPYRIEWTAQLAHLTSKQLSARTIQCDGSWRAPELIVTNLSAELGGGQLNASVRLNVNTREFAFTNSSCFDPHAIATFLTEKTRDWLAQFSWAQPPALQAWGSLILPVWANRQPDWRSEVQPTIKLAGKFAVTNGTFRGIVVDSAHGDFSYSNLVWRLSPLIVTPPQGTLALTDVENDATKEYHWHAQGKFAPDAIEPLLASSRAERALGIFTFTQPLFLNADVRGRLYDNDSISAMGQAALTNFTIHGETVSSVESAFHYTNRVLEFFRPRLRTGAQRMAADGITVDFNSWRIYFTNGVSTADPRAVARAIGSKAGEVMAPYRFGQPCPARVNGYAPLRGMEDADLWFESEGAPLEWLKLKTPRITGQIHWLGETLILTNLAAAFYGGEANGFANFDFRPKEGADFGFTTSVKNANVHQLATDLASPTNHLEGELSGRFVMTSANSEDWHTWNGYGQADLRDGLIWDVPVFGILSPVLNAFMPGLGSSRATDAKARFDMTNGVIFSDNLEIRSTMMRMQYTGTVDLQSRINAHVTAQLLRDTWVVGPLLSTALWPVSKLFEFKITGTLQRPQSEPVYVPKFFLMPLHPFRSLEDILSNSTNAYAPPPK